MIFSFLSALTITELLLFTLVTVILSFELGSFIGKRHKVSSKKEDKSPIGSVIAGMLGLLAFFLAFTFSLAANRFDERRLLVLDEANAIETTYLRAGYLPDPYGTKIRSLLKEYVSIRINAIQAGQIDLGLKQSGEIQNHLWQQAVEVAQKNMNSELVALFIESLNQLIDLHAKRVSIGIHIRIPAIVWWVLYFVMLLSMGSLGYQFGLAHVGYRGMMLLLMLSFCGMIALIADLDRPQEGLIKTSQQPLMDVLNRFQQQAV